MYVFFFVSGCLFHTSTFKSFFTKKTKRILLPYYAWGTVTLIYFALIEHRFRQLELTVWDCIEGLLFGIYDKLEFNTPLWFVTCYLSVSFLYLLLYKALTALLRRQSKKDLIIYPIMFCAFLFCFVGFRIWNISCAIFSIYLVPRFLLAYLCGNIFERYLTRFLSSIGHGRLFFVGISLTALSAFSCYYLRTGVVTIILGVIGTLLLSLGIGKQKGLELIGKSTFTIMCIHGPIYRVLVFLFGMILHRGTDQIRENLLYSLCITIITIFLSLVINQIVLLLGHEVRKIIEKHNLPET